MRTPRFSLPSASLAALLATVLFACSSAPAAPQQVPVIVPETTKVTDADTRARLAGYDPGTGTLRFAATTPVLDSLKPGDVLVSEPAAAAPDGFLLKVRSKSAEGADVVVRTEPASLEDAIYQADIQQSGSLSPDAVRSATTNLSGVRIERVRPLGTYGFKVTIDHQLTAGAGPADAKVRLQGELSFNAGYDVGISIRPRLGIPPAKINKVYARIGFDERASVKLSGRVGGGIGVELKIATFKFAPIVFAVGPVPVVIVPTIDVLLGASGQVSASLSYEVTQVASAQLGVEWTPDGGWRNTSGREFSLDAPGKPALEATMKARAYGRANGSFLFYGAAGPEVGFQAGAEVDAAVPRNPTWILNGFVKGDLAFVVRLPVFGTIAEYRGTLFEWSKEFLRAPNQAPSLAVTSPANGATVPYGGLGGTSFTAAVADAEDGEACCTVTWASSLDGPMGSGKTISFAFATPATRTVTATATDSQGAANTKSVTVTAGNLTPSVTISAPVAGGTFYTGVAYGLSALANDPNEPGAGCSSVRWSSSNPADAVAAPACTGSVTFSGTGGRTLVASATDSQGATGTATVTVMVTNPPAGTALITSPADNTTWTGAISNDSGGRYAMVPFNGSATYSDGGAVPGDRLQWYTSFDGSLLGTGASIVAKLYGGACKDRTHAVTLRALNADGTLNTTSAAVRVTVPGPAC